MPDLLQKVVGCKLTGVLQGGPELAVTIEEVTGVGTYPLLDSGLIVELDYERIKLVEPEQVSKLVPAEFLGNYPDDPQPRLIIGEQIMAVLHSEYWPTAGLLLQNGRVLRSGIDSTRVTWVGPYVARLHADEIAECAVFPDMTPLVDHYNLLQLVCSQK
jgi:hypothetical protein